MTALIMIGKLHVLPTKHAAGQLSHAVKSDSCFYFFIIRLLAIFYLVDDIDMIFFFERDMMFLEQRNSSAIIVSLKGLVLCIRLHGITTA
jgi:hypothetical protein